MTEARALVMDDDEFLRRALSERLSREGHDVVQAGTVAEARAAVERAAPDLALLDLVLPDGSGIEVLEELVRETDALCVVMTAHGTIESAVKALRLGAHDYLEKPFSMDRVAATVASALELTALRREVRALRRESGLGEPVVAESPEMEEVLELLRKVAPARNATVLLTGETGTGKGLVARVLHRISPRAEGPLVNVTCSALAPSLMESELFGHEKGAFTDARTLKRGLVEVADGGTLFLDEVGELSLALQGKLLRFLEDHTFRRVGGTEDLSVDVRVVAATNRDLERMVEEGEFRADLYYRLSTLPVEIPPLRERDEDIPALAKHLLELYAGEFGKEVRSISPEAHELLARHPWPGNVRELRNVIERAVLLAPGDTIGPELLPAEIRSPSPPEPTAPVELGPEGTDLEALEASLLRQALEQAEGNQTEAGRLLGLTRHQVRRRMEKYGVEA